MNSERPVGARVEQSIGIGLVSGVPLTDWETKAAFSFDIGLSLISPCGVTDGQYPDGPILLINFVNDAVDVWLFAERQVPQLSPHLSAFRRRRAAKRICLEA